MNYKFAIPLKGGIVSDHFGQSKEFCFIEVIDRKVVSQNSLPSPKHNHGVLPEWLSELEVTHVFANGIGQKAIDLMTENKIEVIWGVPSDKPEVLVKAYLDSQLVPGVNLCDH